MDTDRPEDEAYEPYEPVEVEAGVDAADVAVEPAEYKSRFVLATLAGIAVVLVGIAVWSLLYAYLERDYVGVSVVFGLVIGYVVREVSLRSDLRARLLAAVLTAILCVLGSVIAQIAHTAREYPETSFPELLKDLLPHTFEIIGGRNLLTFLIFGAAVVVAFLSAGPARPKQADVISPATLPPPGDDHRTDDHRTDSD